MPVTPVRRSLLLTTAFLLTAATLAALFVHTHLERTLTRTAADLRSAGNLSFTLHPLHLPPNPGFTPVLSSSNLHSAAQLGDRVFLAGPGELLEFTLAGTPVRTFHTGLDLPGFPLGPLLAARLGGAATPRLLVATTGAGLLSLDPANGNLNQFLPADTSLRDITALAALPTGDLLLGTRRHGVLRYDGEHLTPYRAELRTAAVTALLATEDTVAVGTQNDGLYLTHAGVTHHLLAELPDPHIEALATNGTSLFAATPDGVAELRNDAFLRTLAPGTFARALDATPTRLTLALYEGGTLTLPLTPARHAPIAPASLADSTPTQALLSLSGALYALRADGLYRQHGSAWVAALHSPAGTLADANIAALNFDPENRLWIGTFDHGLDVVTPGQNTARHLEDDHLFCINRIATDPRRQTEAVATANGLVLFDRAGTPRQVLTRRDGLINDHVTDLAFSPGSMTLATPAGLTFVSSAGVESLYAFQGLVNNHVYSLAVSPDGNHLLAGTLGGLSLLDHATVRSSLTASNSPLRHNWISAVTPLPAFAGGGFLLGTYGGGLMQLTPANAVTAMPGSPPDAVINPNALLATSTHLYAGSLGQGLFVYGRSSGRWQPLTAGLPSLNVTALATHNAELYVGTDNGLVHIAEANLPQ